MKARCDKCYYQKSIGVCLEVYRAKGGNIHPLLTEDEIKMWANHGQTCPDFKVKIPLYKRQGKLFDKHEYIRPKGQR